MCRASLGSGTVIVASGWSPADISVAAALAARIPGSAVLYSAPGSLPGDAGDLLCEHRPARVVLVGGTAALGTGVATSARRLAEGATVERLSGATRIDTAAEVARTVLGSPGNAARRTLVIANGWSAPDLGVAAAVAARTANSAVLYVERDTLPDATAQVIADYRPAKIVIVGGVAAVSADVAEAISAAAPAGTAVERVEGATRTSTAAEAARSALGSPSSARTSTLVIANGWSPPDIGVAAAVAARTDNSAVLYVEPDALPDSVQQLIADYRPAKVIIIGGTAAIPQTVRAAIAAAAPAASVERITGATRTHTAANAAQRTLPSP